MKPNVPIRHTLHQKKGREKKDLFIRSCSRTFENAFDEKKEIMGIKVAFV
jgi:hypothetical protein